MTIYVAGRVNIDTIIGLDSVFLRGRKYTGRVVSKCVGGTGANIAIAMVRFNRELRVKLIASIGRDYADYILSTLSSEGIDVTGVTVYDGISGRAYIFIDKECEATIVSIPGVNEYPPDPNTYMGVGSVVAVVLANTSRETALNLIDIARRYNAPLFLDPGKSWFSAGDVSYLGSNCFILPNRYEFAELFGIEVESYMQYLPKLNAMCTIIVKLGAEGAIAIDSRSGRVVKVSPLKLEGLGLEARSTAGCGDVFTGVFVARYLESRSLVDALEYASLAAGLKRSRIPSSDAPTRSEIEDALVSVRGKGLIDIMIREL